MLVLRRALPPAKHWIHRHESRPHQLGSSHVRDVMLKRPAGPLYFAVFPMVRTRPTRDALVGYEPIYAALELFLRFGWALNVPTKSRTSVVTTHKTGCWLNEIRKSN
jgi:hypothetical protein